MGEYKRRAGTPFSDKDIQTIGEELAKLGPDFTPEDVVAVASKKRHRLHKFFEWDDEKAAVKFRVQQARRMIRAVEFIVNGDQVRKYVSVQLRTADKRSERRYVDLNIVATDDVMRAQVMARMMRELESMQVRYGKYEELLGPIRLAISELQAVG